MFSQYENKSWYITLNETVREWHLQKELERDSAIKAVYKKTHSRLSDLSQSIKDLFRPNVVRERRRNTFERDALEARLDCYDFETPNLLNSGPDYFNSEKIAIYTVVFGMYDTIHEPIILGDNCDFYVISDHAVKLKNGKNILITGDDYGLGGLSNVDKNRYFKMHPHILFPDYRYSVYLDGNIQAVTDLTEFVNRIGKYGMAFHRHCLRNCVFKEIEALLFYKPEMKESIEAHREFLMSEGMPLEYGLVECPVIARDHQNKICMSIMDEWWEQFQAHAKRDQISLPYVLYKNGIKVDDVTTLGTNVFKNTSVSRINHV